MLKPLVN